ncbi:transcription initiation factor TFIID subunit 9-like [Liolophura sinensis]|uniref:transcription initiation factor TFIID subunit 9-like n=1 Tax=Liolophura sinensis TaxID=3198878 RepID=UPI0031598DBD
MAAPKSSPRDAQVMAAILKDMGVTDYEPRVINQMLEFAYRYVTDILDDAKVYASHANKKVIDAEDVKLAVQCKMDHTFTTPPPRDLLMGIARQKNSQALPLVKPYTGPRLPPDRYCLSAPNYRLKSLRKPRIQIGLPMSQLPGGGQRISLTPVHTPGKVGSVSLGGGSSSTLTVVTKGVTMPTVTMVNKPSVSSASAPRPLIRLTTGITGAKAAPGPVFSSTLGSGVNPLKRKLEEDDTDKM